MLLPRPSVITNARAGNGGGNGAQGLVIVDDDHGGGAAATRYVVSAPIGTSTAILSPTSSINRSITATRTGSCRTPMLESSDYLIRQAGEITGAQRETEITGAQSVGQPSGRRRDAASRPRWTTDVRRARHRR